MKWKEVIAELSAEIAVRQDAIKVLEQLDREGTREATGVSSAALTRCRSTTGVVRSAKSKKPEAL